MEPTLQIPDEISELSCRLCLRQCSDQSSLTNEFIEDYENFTGYSFQESDIPKRICRLCSGQLIFCASFRKKCEEVEEFLRKLVHEYDGSNIHEDVLKSNWTEEEIIEEVELVNEEGSQYQNLEEVEYLVEDFEQIPVVLTSPAKKFSRPSEKYTSSIINGRRTYFCEHCDYSAITSTSMKHHRQTKHLQDFKPYFCDICNNGFPYKNKDYLRRHMVQQHIQNKSYLTCEDCGRQFIEYSRLHYHKLRVHVDRSEWRFQCQYCMKKFYINKQYQNHLKMHRNERNHCCKFCYKSFVLKNELQNHLKSAHRKELDLPDEFVECLVCGKKFKNKYYLNSHLKIHQDKQFFCPCCPNNFISAVKLRDHVTKQHPDFQMPRKGTQLRNVDLNKVEYDDFGNIISKKL